MSTGRTSKSMAVAVVTALGLSAGWPALAGAAAADSGESPDAAMLQEVVVTAQKRKEPFQDVPLSVTVMDQKQILDRQLTNVADLALVSPAMASHPGNGGLLTIRGIGTASFARSAEGDVAMIVDGVALPGGANPQDPAQLFDVKSVEVLEGPQGTLFGKNAAAGAIIIETNPPDPAAPEIIGHVEYDSRGRTFDEGVINLPVTGDSAVRIATHYTDPGEVYFDDHTGHWNDDLSAGTRMRYLYAPSDRLQINAIADYTHTSSVGDAWSVINAPAGSFLSAALAACGITPTLDSNLTCLDARTFSDFKDYGGSFRADYELANGTKLTSISAVRRTEYGNNYDTSNVDIDDIFNLNDAFQRYDTISQELRVTSPSSARVEYVAGLYLYDSSIQASGDQAGTFNSPLLVPYGLTLGNSFRLHGVSRSYAGYGNATWHITRRFALLAGLRITRDEVSSGTYKYVTPGSIGAFGDLSPLDASVDRADPSGRVGVKFNLSDDAMLYATVTRGYKGPAINDQAPVPTVPLVVRPEVPWNYELGSKLRLLGGRLLVAGTAYYERVEDYQEQVLDTSTALSYFTNAPAIQVRGVELSVFGAPTPRVSLSLGADFNNATFGRGTHFACGPTQTAALGCQTIISGSTISEFADASGSRVPYSPLWKATGFGEYHVPLSESLEGFLQGTAVYSDSISYSPVYDPGNSYGAYWLLGSRLGVRSRDGRWAVAIFGKNLLGKRIPVVVFDTPVAAYEGALGSHSQYLDADSFRSFGVAVDFRF